MVRSSLYMYGVVGLVSLVSIYLGIFLFDTVVDLFGAGGIPTDIATAASDSILLLSSVGGALIIAIIAMWDLS